MLIIVPHSIDITDQLKGIPDFNKLAILTYTDALTFYSGIPKKFNFSYKIPKWAKVTSVYFISPLMYTP